MMTTGVVAFDVIPAALRAVPTWVGWHIEERDRRLTKVPYQAARPRHRASSTDPTTWTDFETARRAVERGLLEGVGFVFVPRFGFVGVDLTTSARLTPARSNCGPSTSFTRSIPTPRSVCPGPACTSSAPELCRQGDVATGRSRCTKRLDTS